MLRANSTTAAVDRRHSHRASFALFAAGFATFSALYCVQPLMPAFSDYFGVTAAISSLSLSLATGVLAFSILLVAFLSEAIARKPLLGLCLLAGAGLTLAVALAPSRRLLVRAAALAGD